MPERNQEVGARSDPFPSEEGDEQILAEYQHEHRQHKQVQIQEELGELWVTVHVPDRKQVNEETNAGDKQRHRHRQRVGKKCHIDLQ